MVKNKNKVVNKKFKKSDGLRRISILSRHPSHNILRTELSRLPFKGLVRLGSTTNTPDKLKVKYKEIVELNSIEAIKNSSSKLRMKESFSRDNVKTADWWHFREALSFRAGFKNEKGYINIITIDALPYPIVAKSHFGSRGKGNYLLNSKEELENWMKGKDLTNYIFEKFYNFNREYRLHVTKDGCFYTCRKMLKSDTPEKDRWYKNDSNSVWILEENEAFDKPSNWAAIVAECVKALNAVGLHIGACDVRVQSTKDSKGKVRKEPEFIVIEINSAPSLGKITAEKYLEVIPKVLKQIKDNK